MEIKKPFLFCISALILLLSFEEFDLEKLTAFNSHGEDTYRVYALKLPASLEFSVKQFH